MLFHCSVHFRNSFKLCINSDPSRRNWVGQFPLALSLRTPTNTIPPTMSFSDRRRRRRDSGEGRGVEEKYIPTESKLWQQSILFSVNWKSECGRDVVLETIVLVSRALETNFMWSWSWSWYWELKSWPSSWSGVDLDTAGIDCKTAVRLIWQLTNCCSSVLDTVGWVIWPVKIVPDMTYNVFVGTLNHTLLLLLLCGWLLIAAQRDPCLLLCRSDVIRRLCLFSSMHNWALLSDLCAWPPVLCHPRSMHYCCVCVSVVTLWIAKSNLLRCNNNNSNNGELAWHYIGLTRRTILAKFSAETWRHSEALHRPRGFFSGVQWGNGKTLWAMWCFASYVT